MTQKSILKELKEILIEEKEALSQNETQKLVEILEKKEAIIPKLDKALVNNQVQESVNDIISELKDLQEINTMLLDVSKEYK